MSEEKSKFHQSVPAPDYLYPITLTALYCGFRRRTLLSLRWRDLDSEAKRWRIPAEFMKTAEDYEAPVSEVVLDELKAYRKRLADTSPVARLSRESPIFGLKPTTSLKRSFQTAVRRAGLEGFTFHDMRRVFLNRLRENDVGIDVATGEVSASE